MKIAIVSRNTTRDTLKDTFQAFDQIIHETSYGKLKGLKGGLNSDLELYVFDGCDIQPTLRNLIFGFKSVAVFHVSDFQYFQR